MMTITDDFFSELLESRMKKKFEYLHYPRIEGYSIITKPCYNLKYDNIDMVNDIDKVIVRSSIVIVKLRFPFEYSHRPKPEILRNKDGITTRDVLKYVKEIVEYTYDMLDYGIGPAVYKGEQLLLDTKVPYSSLVVVNLVYNRNTNIIVPIFGKKKED